MKLSNCCNAPIIENTDFCSACKEHCEAEEESWEDRFEEKFGYCFKKGVEVDKITQKNIEQFISEELKNHLRPNDVSSWIAYGEKRGYTEFYDAKIRTEIEALEEEHQSKIKEIFDELDKGHGGGNYRRIIHQLKSKYLK